MKTALFRQNLLVILAMTVVVAAASAMIYSRRILTPTNNDYGSHIQFAIDMLKGEQVPAYTLAHPVLQALLISLLWISRGKVNLWLGMIFIQVAAQVVTALLLYFWFGTLPGRWGDARRASWAATLTIAAPVMVLAFRDGLYYFGYIGLASYHNPTVHLLRPFALASFLIAVRALEAQRSPHWLSGLSAFIIILSALIKPNYALVILPALALVGGLRLLRGQPFDVGLGLLGFAIPACLVLAGQAVVTYGEGGGIIFSPLTVEGGYSGYLLIKFLLSILFPLTLLVLYSRQLFNSREMSLAWIVFVTGALQMYLLAEKGDRLFHGNFRWSAQIGLFLLFAASTRYVLRCLPDHLQFASWRRYLPLVAYLTHILAGVVYYIYTFTSPGYG